MTIYRLAPKLVLFDKFTIDLFRLQSDAVFADADINPDIQIDEQDAFLMVRTYLSGGEGPG